MRRYPYIFILLLIGALSMTPSIGWAAALTWIGTGGDNDFNTSANWSPNNPPDASDTCTINSTSNRQPSILTNATCGSLTLGTGGTVMTLTFAVNNLTITGDVTIGANGRISPSGTATGIFTVGGNWSDDLATTNFLSVANLQLQFIFNGASKTTSTNESFYDVSIAGTITL